MKKKISKLFLILGCATGMLLMYSCSSDKEDLSSEEAGNVPPPLENPTGEDLSLQDINQTAGETPWGAPGEGPLTNSQDSWQKIPKSVLNFPTIYFAFDQSRIGFSERKKLEVVANYLIKNKNIGLIVEGNCDERGSEEYNRALGERRALAVKDYLVKLGVEPERIKTISYGEDNPAVKGTGEAVWAKNRRADLFGAKMQ